MPHAYCTSCETTVTVDNGLCLAGHTIEGPITDSRRGRHRAPSRWDKLRPGRIMTARQHDTATRRPTRPEPEPPARQPDPPPPPQPDLPPPAAPTIPTPQAPTPVPVSQWMSAEPSPRSSYSSSMLEMLGIDDLSSPAPVVTASTVPAPVWQAPADPQTGLEKLPTLSDMRTVEDDQTDTGTLIERLWVATEQHEAVRPAAGLGSGEFARVPARTYRWSVVLSALVVLVLAVVLLQIGVRLPDRMADEAITTYRSALTEAQGSLSATTDMMATITDPEVPTEGLADAAVALSQLDSASRELFNTATDPLPSTPPLVSRSALDALTSVRSDMADASQEGLSIERRLGDVLTYRLVFDRAFVLPDLPVSATPDRVSSLGVELGLGLAATLDAIEVLPSDPAFQAHRSESAALAGRYADWQIEYLSALRADDPGAAGLLVEELQNGVARLRGGLAGPLGSVREWATERLEQFEETLALLEESLTGF